MELIDQRLKLQSYFPTKVMNQLNKWEQIFVTSIKKNKYLMTDKQKEILNKLVLKYKLQPQVVTNSIVYLPTGTPEGYSHTQSITTREYRKNRNKNRRYGSKKK